jgi:hypothetical protein
MLSAGAGFATERMQNKVARQMTDYRKRAMDKYTNPGIS